MTDKKVPPNKLGPQRRSASFFSAGRSPVDTEARTAELSFSSDAAVDMWFGKEVLSHDRKAVRLDGVRQANMPLLFNHDANDLLGVVESIRLEGGKGKAVVRFGKDARGDWAMQQAADGILRNVSFMYRVYSYEEGDADTYTATDWEPFEISLVTVPADATVGVGRSNGDSENAVTVVTRANNADASAPTVTRIETMPEVTPAPSPDLDAVRKAAGDAAAAAERARISEIEGLARIHNLGHEWAAKQVNESASIEAARGAALLALQARGASQKPAGEVDMSKREASQWSLVRAVAAAAAGDWSSAGLELEVSRDIEKRTGRQSRGKNAFFMPANIGTKVAGAENQRATFQVGAPTQGGNLVQTSLLSENFIEYLRNASVTAKLGAQFLTGLRDNVDIPSQTGTATSYWVGESGALTESEATFGKVSLRPKTVGALSKFSRLMLLQASPAIEALARQDLFASATLAIDAAALYGTGASNQPTGIAATAGIGSVVGGTNGATWTFDHFIQLYSAPRIANVPQANLGFAINAKTYGYLTTLKSTTGSYLWTPAGVAGSPADTLRGYPYAVSNQLRSTLTKGTSSGVCSEAIFGNWQELLIGEWGVNEILVNPYDSTGFTNGDVLVRLFQTVDVGVRHAASFAYMSDGLTTGF